MIGEIDMIRTDMISTVGREYLTSNIENDEYSYPKAFAAQSLTFNPIRNKAGRAFEKLDIRFVKDNVTVLIEPNRILQRQMRNNSPHMSNMKRRLPVIRQLLFWQIL